MTITNQDRPKGAAGHILAILSTLSDGGRIALSLESIATKSGYSVPTVRMAIRRLENDRYILRHCNSARQPTSYEVLADRVRRALLAGELIGLIKEI
jgi:hypothetical protein